MHLWDSVPEAELLTVSIYYQTRIIQCSAEGCVLYRSLNLTKSSASDETSPLVTMVAKKCAGNGDRVARGVTLAYSGHINEVTNSAFICFFDENYNLLSEQIIS